MSTTHNRIKVADLEKNEQNKILTTNSSGELEFSNLDEIKIDSYNGLDYTQEGKSLDARQGKVLKDLADNKVDKAFGSAQANKFLGTDENGNLKMFPFPNFQAPFLKEVSPPFLPNSTGNLTIKGDFFIPSMCDRVNNPNAIIIDGIETIHYALFISSQEIVVNITTGNVEGSYSCILNNGLTTTKTNAFLITFGTVFKPKPIDWENINLVDVSEESTARIVGANTFGTAKIKNSFFSTPINNDFSVIFKVTKSPLQPSFFYDWHVEDRIDLIDVATNTIQYSVLFETYRTQDGYHYFSGIDNLGNKQVIGAGMNLSSFDTDIIMRKKNGVFGFYLGSGIKFTPPFQNNIEMYLKVSIKSFDIIGIKLVK